MDADKYAEHKRFVKISGYLKPSNLRYILLIILSTRPIMKALATINHISQWLRNYARHAGANGFVVGISGGIDSAVVSALCARTDLDVLLLSLPIRQKSDQLQRAQNHINQLTQQFPLVRSHCHDLTEVFETFERSVPADDSPNRDLAMANTRSRLRMATLYYYGQINGLLLAGTGNKVEDFGVGFFTKYGDGGVDISPIGGLVKSQVYQLAEALEIDEAIRQATPTDGLWDTERSDEQQMGASYPELEWAMAQYGQGRLPEDFSGREREVLTIYQRLNRAAQHKIQPIPVCPIPEILLA